MGTESTYYREVTESASRSLGAILAVNRTVGIVLVTLLFFGLGERTKASRKGTRVARNKGGP